MKKISVVCLVIIFLIATAGCCFYLFDSSNEDNLKDNIESNQKENEEINTENDYTMNDLAERVYGKDGVQVEFVLYNDESFEYFNNITNESGVGRYSVSHNKIYLNFMFTLNSNDEYVESNLKKELIILSKTEITSEFSQIEIQDGDIILTTLNQPARSGDNFCTMLSTILNEC